MERFVFWLRDLARELRRRRIYQVVALYAVGVFGLLQVADVVFEPLGIPESAFTLLVVLAAAGFPPALALGWMFDLTARGLERTPERPTVRLPRGGPLLVLSVAVLSLGTGWSVWTLMPGGPAASGEGGWSRADADPRRIAVLYLDDHSEEGTLGYLAAGITEALILELQEAEGLIVTTRNGVKPFRGSDVSLDSIVRLTRAGSIVAGSVMAYGGRVRVTVQLIDGRDGSHLDSKVVESAADDLFALQDSLTTEVARALRKRLGRAIRLRGVRSGTRSVEAWTAYNRGQEELETAWRFRRTDAEATERMLKRADSLFEEAARADGAWPAPLVRRAVVAFRFARIHGPLPGVYDPAWAARGEALLEEALARDSSVAEAYEHRGVMHLRLARAPGSDAAQRLEHAEADLRRALRLEPERAGALWALSEVLVNRTRFSEAVAAAERALRADAFLEVELAAIHLLYYSMLQLGPRDEAVRWCEEGRRRFPTATEFLTCRLWILGTFPQVEPDVERAWLVRDSLLAVVAPQERDTWRSFADLWTAKVIARAGLADSARAVLRRARGGEDTPPSLAYDEAHVHLVLGDRDAAVRLLRAYLAAEPDTAYVREDWWFEDLRDYAPFRALVGLPEH